MTVAWVQLLEAGIETYVSCFDSTAYSLKLLLRWCFRGLCHEMNIFWRLWYFLYMRCFYIILFLSWWTNQTQCFSLLLWNYLQILKTLPVNRFKDTKNAYRKPLVILKNHTESCMWQLNSCAFSLQPMSGGHKTTSTNHREGNSEEGFRKHFQNY